MSQDGGCPWAVTGVLFALPSEVISLKSGFLESVIGVLFTSLTGCVRLVQKVSTVSL